MFRARLVLLASAALAPLALALPASAVSTVVADWQMNEAAGETVLHDSTSHGLNGTIVQPNDEITMGGGVFDWRLKWPTSAPVEPDRILTVPDSPLLDVAATDIYTLTVRYKTTYLFGNVVQKGQATAVGGQIKIQQPGGRPSCLFTGSLGKVTARTPTPINDGVFHTVSCVRSPDEVQVFVDGVLKQTNNGSTGAIDNSKPYSIGGKTNCDQVTTTCDYFTGSMDYVRITKG